MRLINQHDIPWQEKRSKSGKYQLAQKDLSLALGGKKDTGTWGGGHPFDVALVRVPEGARNWPLHTHTTQWEFYVVLSGRGSVRSDDGAHPVKAGDCFLLAPGESHQIASEGDGDLIFYVIADNPQADISYYPESDKWFIKPQRKTFRLQEVGYYDGEE
ncbi:MAG TPA: cupin domain-containing protein [Pantanalinema sp.]